MTRPVAAGEPSMEDILASIRKIIAEEPAVPSASVSAGGPFAVASSPTAPSPLAKAPSATAPRPSDMAARSGGEEQAKAGGSALFGRLSEALRGGANSAPPQAAAAPRGNVAGLDDDLADLLAEPAPRSPASLPLRDAAAMRGNGLPLPGGRRESPFGGPLVSAPPPPPASRIEPSFGAMPAPAPREAGSRPADLGAFVPARPDAARPADPAGAPPFGRRINESGAPQESSPQSPAPSAPPQVIAAMPAASPASPVKSLPATAEPAVAATPAREVKAAEVAVAGPTVIAAMPAAPAPAKPAAAESDPDTAAAAQSALSMLAKGLKASATASEVEKVPTAPTAAAEAAPAPGDARLAETPSTTAISEAAKTTVPVPRDASAMRAQSPAAGPPAPIAPPTEGADAERPREAAPAVAATAPAVTDAAPPTEPVTPEPIEPVSRDEPAAPTPRAGSAEATLPLAAAAAVGDVRTLEDTVAELLRPMLRQWLDDNMPRIVEKALRVEIAGRPAAPSKPKG